MVDRVLVRGGPLPLRELVRAHRPAPAPEHHVAGRLVPDTPQADDVVYIDKVANARVALKGVGAPAYKWGVRGAVQIGLV